MVPPPNKSLAQLLGSAKRATAAQKVREAHERVVIAEAELLKARKARGQAIKAAGSMGVSHRQLEGITGLTYGRIQQIISGAPPKRIVRPKAKPPLTSTPESRRRAAASQALRRALQSGN